MSIPNPYSQLEGHCATINNNTLYVLSAEGFQSLPLQKKAQWSKEANSVPVNGPACVQVGSGSDAALWVIGGESNDGSFTGLQKYNFATKQWETVSSASDDVIKQRTNHSVAYLPASNSILVYAGSQPTAPSELSSQTFTISTQSPYNIESYTSTAPPTTLPILLPWTDESAIMLGGVTGNTKLYTFDPAGGWQRYQTDLAQAPSGVSRGMIVDVPGGGKVLELYDFSVSPNTVSSIVLQGTNGQPAQTGQVLGNGSSSSQSSSSSSSTSRSSRSRSHKRQLSLNNWPQYQSKNAPTATRSDCSLSQDSNGLAVIAGGSATAPLALFNQDDNSWVDAANFFDSKSITQTTSTPSNAPAGTSAPTTAPAAPASSSSSSTAAASPHSLKLLGIILGVLCGIAAIFIIALLYLRHRRMKRRRLQGEIDEKGERMSFQDRGASFMKEAGGSVDELNRAHDGGNNSKHNSLALMAGKFGSKRNTINHVPQKSSFDSTANLVKDKDGEMLEPVEMVDIDGGNKSATGAFSTSAPRYGNTLTVDDLDAKARRKRSSGWSKYFATSGPTGPNGLSHIPDAYHKSGFLDGGNNANNNSNPSTSEQARAAGDTSSSLLPPLDLGIDSKTLDGQRLSHVATGSPSINDSAEDFSSTQLRPAQAQTGLIVDPNDRSRPRSLSDTISSFRSTSCSSLTSDYNTNEPGQQPTVWSPNPAAGTTAGTSPANPQSATFHNNNDKVISTTGLGRRSSSMYSTSVMSEPRGYSRGRSAGFFPGAGTSYRPPRKPRSTFTSEVDVEDWPAPPRSSVSTVLGGGTSPALGTTAGNAGAGAGGAGGFGTLASVKEQLRDSQSSLLPPTQTNNGTYYTYPSNAAVAAGGGTGTAKIFKESSAEAAALPPDAKSPMSEDLTWLDLGQEARR